MKYSMSLKLPSSYALILNHEKTRREITHVRENYRGLPKAKGELFT
jgi:hypothetical protein